MEYYPDLKAKNFDAMLPDILMDEMTKFINSDDRVEDVKNISVFELNGRYQGVVTYLYSRYKNGRLVKDDI